MSIYYLTASLPVLTFGMKPPFSSRDFLDDCERVLLPSDHASVREAFVDAKTEVSHPAVRQWQDFLRALRNELVVVRAERLKRDAAAMLHGERDPSALVIDAVEQAVKAPDPMAAEQILDNARWRFLDEIAAGHYFDMTGIIVYGLKLKILERYQAVNVLAGKEKFKEIEHLAVADKVA